MPETIPTIIATDRAIITISSDIGALTGYGPNLTPVISQVAIAASVNPIMPPEVLSIADSTRN
jgi:hypothetical protein